MKLNNKNGLEKENYEKKNLQPTLEKWKNGKQTEKLKQLRNNKEWIISLKNKKIEMHKKRFKIFRKLKNFCETLISTQHTHEFTICVTIQKKIL